MAQERRPIYILDTNIFIEAHRRYYALDICPGFWQCLTHHNENGRLISIDRVREEIAAGDSLYEWIQQAPHSLFVPTAAQSVIDSFSEMVEWVYSNGQFLDAAKAEFARNADGWVAAYAQVYGAFVVTHEVSAPSARKTVPLPDLCREFDVAYQNTFDMLRELGACFGWATN